ncbi:MAG: RNA polymerase sigma factor [Chloroflexi bacterium]|nr:RNA polymerase sigma factor [Chloroflexota bacterium]
MDADLALAAGLATDLDLAFPTLVDAHARRLFTIANRYLGVPSDAEEVTQDALVRAYDALSSYDRDRIRALRLRPWLATITLNLARNRRRRIADRRPATSIEPLVKAGWQPMVTSNALPSAIAERREEERDLAIALLSLAPRIREAVVLRHVDGMSVTETAVALGRPEGTVKAQVARGLAILRRQLTSGPHDQPRSEKEKTA